METLTNVATAASRAVFGDNQSQKPAEKESGIEPVSGVKGSGTTDDPYDGGNNEDDPTRGGAPASSARTQLDDLRPEQQTGRKDDTVGGLTDTTAGATHPSTAASDPDVRDSGTRTGLPSGGQIDRKDDVAGGPSQSADDTTRSSNIFSDPFSHEGGAQTQLAPKDSTPTTSSSTGLEQVLPTGGADRYAGTGLEQVLPVGGGADRYQKTDVDPTDTTSGTQGYSTFIANKLDPHAGGPRDVSTTDNDNHSSLRGADSSTTSMLDPFGSQKSDGATNVSGTGNDWTSQGLQGQTSSLTGTATTTGQSDLTSGDHSRVDHHGSSAIGGDTADRLPGQTDTPRGPSGGIAQGGVPQGINMPGSEVRPEHQTDKTGVTSLHSNDPKFTIEHPSSSNDASVAGVGHSRGVIGGFGTVQPSVGADPRSAQKPLLESQGGDRPTQEPSEESTQAIREKKHAAEQTVGGGQEDLLGASGEAGPIGSMRRQSERGTGQEWVRSTGYAAEGGDFDAAKPGAGKEADRLMDIHGVHRSEGPGPIDPDENTGGGLSAKLKEKLHLGHH